MIMMDKTDCGDLRSVGDVCISIVDSPSGGKEAMASTP